MQYYILFNTVLLIVSSFLTWVEPKLFIITMKGFQMIDGKIVLVLGILGFVSICYELLRRKAQLYWIYGLIGFMTMIITGMVFYSYYQNQYSGGAGLYLAALGGIQLTGTYVVFIFQPRKPAPS
ncbi:MAG: hypothetical protein VST69_05255 [Nitrospirota bacterium]|nr:hypothetical protein [Nitrospirota bacterium]NOY83720.1 hypothetical protein [Candidatus Manganitrophaceae bacterium]